MFFLKKWKRRREKHKYMKCFAYDIYIYIFSGNLSNMHCDREKAYVQWQNLKGIKSYYTYSRFYFVYETKLSMH